MKYEIEHLIDLFAKHAKKAQKTQIELIKQFKENNPDEQLPKHFKSDFNLPLALMTICKEIQTLKEKDEKII